MPPSPHSSIADQVRAVYRRGWSIAWIGRVPWPLLFHTAGTPEAKWHRGARVFLWFVHHVCTWRIPKWLGLDVCAECGVGPCGTRIGREWRCGEHSVFVAPGHHGGRAGLRVLKGGRSR